MELNYLSIDIGDDVMMSHYDSIVKPILEKYDHRYSIKARI